MYTRKAIIDFLQWLDKRKNIMLKNWNLTQVTSEQLTDLLAEYTEKMMDGCMCRGPNNPYCDGCPLLLETEHGFFCTNNLQIRVSVEKYDKWYDEYRLRYGGEEDEYDK